MSTQKSSPAQEGGHFPDPFQSLSSPPHLPPPLQGIMLTLDPLQLSLTPSLEARPLPSLPKKLTVLHGTTSL